MAQDTNRLLRRWQDELPDGTRAALRAVLSFAERRGVDVYLVGGAVRDLLLDQVHTDVDLVVEGDAIELAWRVATKLRARVVAHPRFGTAALQGEGFRLDLARARAERYERPGALPTVRPGTLVDDLARRDFTMNAMALRLGGQRAAEIIDPHGGRGDLARRRIRVLYDASFRDDATRALRALRYAGRLGFRLEPRTESLLQRDLLYLDTISGARLRHEFERIAVEERIAEILRLASRLGVFEAVQPALAPGTRALGALARLPELAVSHRDAVLFCLLLADASAGEADAAIARLALTGRQAEAVRGLLALRSDEAKLAQPSLRPSDVTRLLANRPVEAIEAFALIAQRRLAADRARRYLEEWRFVRPRLNGRDVEALGVAHGPQVGEALAALRQARLDGQAKTREDEMALVRSMLSGRGRPAEARRG
jgi:tRNA nucleotidyltransferase (CCA-adding enzyme)